MSLTSPPVCSSGNKFPCIHKTKHRSRVQISFAFDAEKETHIIQWCDKRTLYILYIDFITINYQIKQQHCCRDALTLPWSRWRTGYPIHDDVIKWKHFPRYWPFMRGIHRGPVNSPHKGQWRGALMFSLIYTRINAWVNNGESGALRRHRVHYDVTVMSRWVNTTATWLTVSPGYLQQNISCIDTMALSSLRSSYNVHVVLVLRNGINYEHKLMSSLNNSARKGQTKSSEVVCSLYGTIIQVFA